MWGVLWRINRDVGAFVRSGAAEGMLGPMEGEQRTWARRIARCYGVSCRDVGSGGKRRPMALERTERTQCPPPREAAGMVVSIARQQQQPQQQQNEEAAPSPPATEEDPSNGSDNSSKSRRRRRRAGARVVGADAEPLWQDDENVGNQMLRRLGWAPGTGIGAQQQGTQEPLAATIKRDRHGLGH